MAGALRRHWPFPTAVAAGLLLVGGLIHAFTSVSAPDFNGPLSASAELIERGEFERAISVLNQRVHPYLSGAALSPRERRLYHLLLARALHGGQLELEVPQRENDLNIIAQYLEAERQNEMLTPQDLANLSRTYLALGDAGRARSRADEIASSSRGLRDAAYRALVRHELERRPPGLTAAVELLSHQLADPDLPTPERIWSLAQQAKVRGELGFYDEAVNQLLRVMPRLIGEPGADLAELHLELGRAYLELELWEQADRELARVDRDEAAAPGSDTRAEAILLRALVDARRGGSDLRLETARDRFQSIVDSYNASAVYPEALLGLGAVEGELGNFAASAEAYQTLTPILNQRFAPLEPTRERATSSMLERYRRLADEGRWLDALRFASIASELWDPGSTPAALLLALGEAHEALAAGVLGVPDQRMMTIELPESADPAARVEAKRHLLHAAEYLSQHAEFFVIDDFDTYTESLWRAAHLYDAAGENRGAIRAFSAFAEVTRGEARRAEARFRLGRAFQALGDYGAAAEVYRGLIADRQSSGVVEVGPWADASLVPLAQCYMLDGTEANDDEAEALLLRVVDGSTGGPARPEYRRALLELGGLYYRRARFDLALERLTEASDRAAAAGQDSADDPELLYRIADARRQLARAIDTELSGDVRGGERRLLMEEREAHLRAAMDMFAVVRERLGSLNPRLRTAAQGVFLRNASFYLGDCAYDLGELDAAIAHYTAARNRYSEDPASLVALMQIVNAHLSLGDIQSARAANERARDLLRSLPADVWNDPSLPMDRDDWQRWLDANTALHERMAAETAG